jgi:amino-acid N-acetyltransferase
MHITQPTTQDLPRIQTLLSANDLPYSDLTPDHLSSFLIVRDGETLVAVGGLEIRQPAALLRSLVVDPAYRGHGLGSHLVHLLEETALEYGIRDLYLLTTGAERFFTHLGYHRLPHLNAPEDIQATPEFSELCPDSAVCMFRRLTHTVPRKHIAAV